MTNKVLAALALVLCSTYGFAHAILVDATPAINGTVRGPDVHVQLRFNARIDATRSRLRVVMPDQKVQTLTVSPQDNPAMLNSQIKGLPRGMYRLQWQVLASDGHITRGEVPFEVK